MRMALTNACLHSQRTIHPERTMTMSIHENNAAATESNESTKQVDLNVEEISIIDLDDRLELAFRCDSKAD
jgi:hypothetical protein